MNPFNTVFLAVKKHCGDSIREDKECFEALALATNIPLDRLDLYLNMLQDLELITFSKTRGVIQITALGKKQEELFA